MRAADWDSLLKNFDRSAPADESAIRGFEAASGIALPTDYRDFLRMSNGGNGSIGEGVYVELWAVGELAQLNDSYQVAEYCPGVLAFGSDGGGEAFAFDLRLESKRVVAVPFIGMDENLISAVAGTFAAFMRGNSEFFRD
jgi:hypothetical protein